MISWYSWLLRLRRTWASPVRGGVPSAWVGVRLEGASFGRLASRDSRSRLKSAPVRRIGSSE